MAIAYIALGSNLGTSLATMWIAIDRVGKLPHTKVLASSTFRETEPVGGPSNQNRYLNGAMSIETSLPARELLNALLQIEKDLGRDRTCAVLNGPRVIDLDLLLYGESVINEDGLQVPHPRMHRRQFVLEPMAEIAPDLQHPIIGKTMRELFEFSAQPMNAFKTKVIHTIAEFRAWRESHRGPLAFVPTMGALHHGHASLAYQARKIADSEQGNVAASIFVNPTQFGPAEDFTKYPRTLDADLAMLSAAGCDVAFVPTAEEMYGTKNINAATQTSLATIDPGPLGDILEGAIRPGHFRGVCTVVLKLLNVVAPTKLVMGQKDYQQNAVLKKMLADLNIPTEHITCDTLREPDGLAMSSRNRYLTAEERPRAAAIFQALAWAAATFAVGERDGKILAAGVKSRIEKHGLGVQYAIAADPVTLESLEHIESKCVFLVAAKLGNTRLIDNMIAPG